MKEKSISFSKWTIDDVVENLGIEVSYLSEGMEYWLHYSEKPSEEEKKVIEQSHLSFVQNVNFWNKRELKAFFLGRLISLVAYEQIGNNIKLFAERELRATVRGFEISGEVDWLISKGFGRPKQPYFCIKEFKKVKNSSNDPEGQLAAAMIAAQALNNNEQTMYGAYLLGRDWTFCTLNGKKFIQSPPYSAATQQGLTDIFMIMKNLKNIIIKEIK